MATPSLPQEMLEYFTQLSTDEQKSVLQLIKTFLKSRKEANSISIEQYNKELKEAERQIEVGNFTTQEDLKKEFEPNTVEQYNKETDEAMKRMDDGHFTMQEELEEAETW